MKNLKALVENYVNQGIKVFGCNLDKTPATRNGFKDATTDLGKLRWQTDDWNETNRLIGLPTGQINKILVVDIDVGKGDGRSTDELRQYIEDNHGPLPDTFTVGTPSGGLHLLYALPEGAIVPSGARFFDKTCSVDVRCEGGYIITSDWENYIPIDQESIDDLYSKLTLCPEWILIFKKSAIEAVGSHNDPFDTVLDAPELLEMRSALAFLSSENRDTWVSVGMALKASGYAQARGLWDEWSMKSDKYDPKDQEKKWKTFKPHDITVASIFYMAQQCGWVTTYKNLAPPGENPMISGENGGLPETVIFTDTDIEDISQNILKNKRVFPKDLLNPGGFVGDIVKYIDSQAIRSQPILSLGAAFAIAGTLMGRRYETDAECLRTNIYAVGLADTGAGKENARSCAKKIFSHKGIAELSLMCSNETIASDAAIFNELSTNPCQLFLLDEIGRLLKTTKNPMKQSHLYNIPTVLQELFSSSNAISWGKSYADTKKKVRLNNPNLSIWGTATPKQFYSSLSEDNLSDGLVSRMLIFESDDNNPVRRKVKITDPPIDLIEQVVCLYSKPTNVTPKGNLSKDGICVPFKVPNMPETDEIFDKFIIECDSMKDKLSAEQRIDILYTRGDAIARKIALILAVGRDVECPIPIIMPEHAEYAIKLVRHLISNMQYVAEHHVSANEYEENLKLIWQIIRDKGHIYAHELTRMTHHLQTWLRKDIIENLIQSNLIVEGQGSDGGTKRKKMYAIVIKE